MILLGLDGCDFRILDPLLSKNRLPFLSSLLARGARAVLKSTIPANTVPSFNSIFTGVTPGNHGIIDFQIRENGRIKLQSSRDRGVPTLWSILSALGKRVIVVNEPVTFPPEQLVNGIMITGFATPPRNRNFIHPAELRDEVDAASGGYVPELDDLNDVFALGKANGVKTITDFAVKNYKAAMYLARRYPWDLLSVIFTSTDRLQHFCMDDMDIIQSHYELLDSMMADICGLDAEANVIVVSDHGFEPLVSLFFVNKWLGDRGLALFEGGAVSKTLVRTGLTSKRLASLTKRLGLYRFLVRNLPSSFRQKIPDAKVSSKIDEKRSAVFLKSTNGGLYFKDRSTVSSVGRGLGEYTNPRGKPICAVLGREEVWRGKFSYRAPDLALVPSPGWELSARTSTVDALPPIARGDKRTGTHSPDGVFIAAGANFAHASLERPLQTWDITPLILALLGIQRPEYMEGTVPREILRGMGGPEVPVTAPQQVAVTPELTEDEERTLEERLRSLGYT